MNKILGSAASSKYNDLIQKGYPQLPFRKNASCMICIMCVTTNLSKNSSFTALGFNYLDTGQTLPAVAIIAPHSIYKSLEIAFVKLQHRDSACRYRLVQGGPKHD